MNLPCLEITEVFVEQHLENSRMVISYIMMVEHGGRLVT